jgi:hypothetical protein
MTRRKRRQLARQSKVMPFKPAVIKTPEYERLIDLSHDYLMDVPLAVKAIQKRVMQTTENLFKSLEPLGYQTFYSQEKDHYYCYKNAGHKVLAVAHADSVQQVRFFNRKGNVIFSPSLDDRLGVAVAVDILPMLGIECDVLITDEEESANSSGSSFALDHLKHGYNWIVEFDRAGEDCVTYDYSSEEWSNAISLAGFRHGYGSYSDICEMEEMGVCAMNVGIGYEHYHSLSAYANMIALDRNLQKFVKFYREFGDTRFQHVMREYKIGGTDLWPPCKHAYDEITGGWYATSKKVHIENRRMMCEVCGEVFWEDETIEYAGYVYCPECGNQYEADFAAEVYEDFCDKFFEEQFEKKYLDTVDSDKDQVEDYACSAQGMD